jgi:predicted transcriptional regulator of viral defense system
MGWIRTIASQMLGTLGEERRRIISDWRVLILSQRLAQREGAPLPDEKNAEAVVKELTRQNAITPVAGVQGVYAVIVPFAQLLPISDEQIVQEANPFAVFSHLTALVAHGLTSVLPTRIHAVDYQGSEARRTPLGTEPQEWIDLRPPARKLPKHVRDIVVEWTRAKGEWDFGSTIAYAQGIAIYVTDVERTLLDSLRNPEKCEGISNVVAAWRNARDAGKLDADKLVGYTDKLNVAVVRQRVGYFLESLKLDHPALKRWRTRLLRGGSVRLIADEPYSANYSENWNLSLNVPGSVLDLLRSE